MDDAVQTYIDKIPAEHRPLFDRIHGLVTSLHPEATVGMSYGMPVYRVGARRLHVGAWKHGISLYGWGKERVDDFVARHPGTRTSTGTIQVRPADAAEMPDSELAILVRAALDD
jgi:uncharacterized protein YdhG (YjbR/CyaY superfamily)